MAISAAAAAAITAVAAVVSTGVAVYSSVASANAQKDAANRQAEAESQQARLMQLNAESAAAEHRKQSIRMQTSQVASAAAAGLSLDSESFLDLMTDTAKTYEQDAQQMERTGQINASLGQQRAAAYKAYGKNAQTTGYLNAGSALLSGTSKVYTAGTNAGWFN